MELCDGGESIQAAHTHMGMSRAVCRRPDCSGLAKEADATHQRRAGPGLCVSTGKAMDYNLTVAVIPLDAHNHMNTAPHTDLHHPCH